MSTARLMQMGAAGEGNHPRPVTDVEDVFSTYLYEGNGSTQTITNGIDLDGEGGLAWIKSRTSASSHVLFDTERGTNRYLRSNTADLEVNNPPYELSAFNSDGFTVGDASGAAATVNGSSTDYASWTFRKAPKFFDVVTYTGNSGTNVISHGLNQTVGCVFIKRTSASDDWMVYHRGTSDPNNKYLVLNTNAAEANFSNWMATTDTSFTVTGANGLINNSGETYVAYLFAHNDGDGEFGADFDADIIKCGSFTTDGSNNATVNLGFEPQWVLVKPSSAAGNWRLIDNMRGWVNGGTNNRLFADSSGAESAFDDGNPTATGFQMKNAGASKTYIYIAIRRGTKVPESGTEVFDVGLRSGSGSDANTSSNILTDASIIMRRDSSTEYNLAGTRLQGLNNLFPESTSAEGAGAIDGWDTMAGLIVNGANGAVNTGSLVDYSWKRAPGFFDVVAYTGDGTSGSYTHNLGVIPELKIIKRREGQFWVVGGSAVTGGTRDDYLVLNTTDAKVSSGNYWGSVDSDTTFSVRPGNGASNLANANFIAYLFATLPGISKVGSYTGTGATLNIDCGFTSGARFVLIKRTDTGGNWFVLDTARGIVSGNDPLLELNSTGAEDNQYDNLDPYSAGFTVAAYGGTSPYLNISGGTYIFYAIA